MTTTKRKMMKITSSIVLIGLLTLRVFARHHSQPTFLRQTRELDISRQLNGFALDFYREVARSTDGNILFSPFSIYTGLTMLGIGAGGSTRNEISSVLKWGNVGKLMEKLRPLYDELSRRNNVNDDVTRLEIANRLWVSNDVKISKHYRRMLYYYFQTRIGRKSFKTNPEHARKNINHWISHRTNKNIRHMFPVRSINSMTQLVLANAIHFKGNWAKPFDVKETKRGKFFLKNGGNVDVDYMTTEDKFPAYFDDQHDVQLVEIPYDGNEYSMILALPESSDLNRVETSIDSNIMDNWISTLTSSSALWSSKFVHLPKFHLEQSLPLTELLQKMAVRDLFHASKADLSGMTNTKTLYCSNALHKAVITVDEEGTVSSAATGIGITMLSYPMTIRFERPFLFYIIHRHSKTIIFSGKMMNPRESKSTISSKDVTMETNDVTKDITNNIEDGSSKPTLTIPNSARHVHVSFTLLLTTIVSTLSLYVWH